MLSQDLYTSKVKTELMSDLGYKSVMQVPKIDKIVVNMGLGQAVGNAKIVEEAFEELKQITGQAPVKTIAKKSIATFKLREGMPIGVKVTLRGELMYNFLDKVLMIALPRVRDFKGLSPKSFDGQGNYTIGIQEFIVFPEIDYDKVNKMKGMDITVVTSAKSDHDAHQLLTKMGFPFIKKEGK